MQLDCGICRLRSWRASDAESLVRHANDREVSRQLRDRFPHPYTAAHAESWLRYAVIADPETNFAIEVDDAAVGGIGLVLGSDVERCSAEIGYWLGRALWGRGIATAAVRELTRYGFERFDLTRVFAVPFAGNIASRRVLEKAGFTLEGIMRRSALKDGCVLDQALYALVR